MARAQHVASLAIELPERSRWGPEDSTVLQGLALNPLQGPHVIRAAAPLVDVYESHRGLVLVSKDRIGVTSLPALRQGQRVTLRIVVKPANPAVTLEDFIRILLRLEGDLPFGGFPVEAKESEDFVDVVCRALMESARRIHREGLCRVYVEEATEGATVRGRLDVRDYVWRHALNDKRVRSIRHHHTTENSYNRIVARGLYLASLLCSGDLLRRKCRTVASMFAEPLPPPVVTERHLSYAGQFGAYRFVHGLARVLEGAAGGDPALPGQSAFLPFVLQPSVLYQRFLTLVMAEALYPDFLVETKRHYVFEDGEGKILLDRGFLIPDVQVVRHSDRRLVLLVDAKYEESFPDLPATDFYQAYVYGHVLSRLAYRTPLPVVLASPASDLRMAGLRRANAQLDASAERPTTWTLGVPLGTLTRSLGRRGLSTEMRDGLRSELMKLIA